MGFFSDLKEDLSHAVNELMPEETADKAVLTQEAGPVAKQQDIPEQEAVSAAQYTEVLNTGSAVPQDHTPAGAAEKEGMGITMQTEAEKSMAEDIAVITAGMKITGDVVADGAMKMNGTIEGNISIKGKLNVSGRVSGNMEAAEIYADGAKVNGEVVSTGAVKIGRDAVIIGNITGTSAVVAGAVKGNIDIKGPVILDSTAIVMGDIKSKSVQINNGAVTEGMCSQCYAEVSPSSFFLDYEPAQKRSRRWIQRRTGQNRRRMTDKAKHPLRKRQRGYRTNY